MITLQAIEGTVSWELLIGIVGILLTVLSITQIIVNLRRNKTSDDKREAIEMTRIIVQLENIGKDTNEIKNAIKDVKEEVKNHAVILTKHDASLEALWKAMDEIRGKRGN